MLDKMSSDSGTQPDSASVQQGKPQCGIKVKDDERHCSAMSVSDNPMPVSLPNISLITANKNISIQKCGPKELPDESDSNDVDVVKIENSSNCNIIKSVLSHDDTIDEPDLVQHHFSPNKLIEANWDCNQRTSSSINEGSNGAGTLLVSSYLNDSSAVSSPSQSTMSTPLSTPIRYAAQVAHSHKYCCQHKSSDINSDSRCCVNSVLSQHMQRAAHEKSSSSISSGTKKLQKFDAHLAPSPYRQLLPIALCIISFATVFSILIVYMDTTEIRHQQFRLNMSRDYELYGVAQDDPTLVAFLREIHMRKYPMHFLKNRDTMEAEQHHNFSARTNNDLTPEMAHYVASLVGGKMNGAVIQSLTGTLANLMTAPWLSDTLNWAGVIVEPEPRRYFTVRKQNAYNNRLQIVHACVSNNPYPKEITIHNEDLEVKINSLLDEETSGFNSRVKCFPLYTLMLACDRVEYDHLSLGVHGYELEILQTLPFDKVKIEIISIHLTDDHQDLNGYVQSITKFLMRKSYKLQKRFGRNYFYQRMNATNRTRKKDILFLKTP